MCDRVSCRLHVYMASFFINDQVSAKRAIFKKYNNAQCIDNIAIYRFLYKIEISFAKLRMQRVGVLREVMLYYTDHYATRVLTQFRSDRRHERIDPWEILNYTFYISFAPPSPPLLLSSWIERAVVTAITLISSLMIMAQGGLVLVNFRFITGGITYWHAWRVRLCRESIVKSILYCVAPRFNRAWKSLNWQLY